MFASRSSRIPTVRSWYPTRLGGQHEAYNAHTIYSHEHLLPLYIVRYAKSSSVTFSSPDVPQRRALLVRFRPCLVACAFALTSRGLLMTTCPVVATLRSKFAAAGPGYCYKLVQRIRTQVFLFVL